MAKADAKAQGWADAEALGLPASENPIMPKVHAPLATLVIAMSVMCYLASLSIGGLILVNRAVDRWTSDIAGEITVQIRPVADNPLEAETQKAIAILEGTDGLSAIRVISDEEAAALLEPWLGKSRILDELPIPRMVTAIVDKSAPPDLAALDAALKAGVKGVSLDTHRQWQDELTAMSGTLRWIGFGVLAIIAGAAVALVVFATRAALETSREVLEVLYLVGARDSFVARQVERRFFSAGLKAGLIGLTGAIATFVLVYAAGYAGADGGLQSVLNDLLTTPDIAGLRDLMWLPLVPVVAMLICLLTARTATMRILRGVF